MLHHASKGGKKFDRTNFRIDALKVPKGFRNGGWGLLSFEINVVDNPKGLISFSDHAKTLKKKKKLGIIFSMENSIDLLLPYAVQICQWHQK